MLQTLIAIDFGQRRIGVAVGQTVTESASPLGIVYNHATGPDLQKIGALFAEWRPDLLIVGMPTHADGSTSDMQTHVKRFITELEQFELPIDTVDERFTSIEAEAKLKEARIAGARGRISKGSIDSAAAVLIAERYLAARNN